MTHSIILISWLPGFPPQACPTIISSLTSPPSISPQSTAALTLALLHKSYAPAPSCSASQGTCVLVWGMNGCSKDCLILSLLRLPQISCCTLSLKCFSSDLDTCPDVGIRTLLHLLRAGPVLVTLLFPPQFLHLTEFCVVLYILFLYSGTTVHFQLVFCMHFCV